MDLPKSSHKKERDDPFVPPGRLGQLHLIRGIGQPTNCDEMARNAMNGTYESQPCSFGDTSLSRILFCDTELFIAVSHCFFFPGTTDNLCVCLILSSRGGGGGGGT